MGWRGRGEGCGGGINHHASISHTVCPLGREQSRHKSDIERLKKEKLELADKVNSLQNQIYKGNEKMDQFKILMNWNQEELEQWALAARQKVHCPLVPSTSCSHIPTRVASTLSFCSLDPRCCRQPPHNPLCSSRRRTTSLWRNTRGRMTPR